MRWSARPMWSNHHINQPPFKLEALCTASVASFILLILSLNIDTSGVEAEQSNEALAKESPQSISPTETAAPFSSNANFLHLKFKQCNYTAYPVGGCIDASTMFCNRTSNLCQCNSNYSIGLRDRCVGHSDISGLCVSSVQCEQIKASCFDAAGNEVKLRDSNHNQDDQLYYNHNLLSGVCKCGEGHYYNADNRICQERILDRKCFFSKDCFLKNHASCENGKCRCKSGFFHDYLSDECRPNLITTLCLYGYIYDKDTQKCRPNGFHSNSYHSGESSISALFWPAVAFFLVIFLLRLLREGMKRDCERVQENRAGHRRHSHRIMRSRAFPAHHITGGHHRVDSSHLPQISSSSTGSAGRSQAEVILLMNSPHVLTRPPAYSSSDPIALPQENPPSYEESCGIATDDNTNQPSVVAAK